MKNKSNRKFKNKISREKLKEMVNDENQLDNMDLFSGDLSSADVEMIFDVTRESRVDYLFEMLNVNEEDVKKAKGKIIKLHPQSTELPLLSTLYKNHNGKYKLETLLNEYHDSILSEGIMYGISYGKKFIVEDIHNKRFSKEDILNMTDEEIFEYVDEKREEI